MKQDSMNTKIIELIDKQILLLNKISSALGTRLPIWKDKTIKVLSEYINADELEPLDTVNTSTYDEDKLAYLELLNELKINIGENPKETISDTLSNKPKKLNSGKSNKVFVIHGHDALARTEVARTLEKIGLEAIVLHEQAIEGKTIIEKFERDASQVSFAVAILTPDDTGYPINKPDETKPRARQNVILELGYFSGILGRSNVAVLYKGDVEIPSDYLGVVYIAMDASGAWQYSLSKELKTAGLKIDLNNLI